MAVSQEGVGPHVAELRRPPLSQLDQRGDLQLRSLQVLAHTAVPLSIWANLFCNVGMASSSAARVALTCSSWWAVERKKFSNWLGWKRMPRRTISSQKARNMSLRAYRAASRQERMGRSANHT